MANYEDRYGFERAQEIRAKLKASAKKRWEKSEEREKASVGQLRRFSDPDEVAKLVIVQNRPDVIEKKRAANTGKGVSVETRAKLRNIQLNKKHSAETIIKIGNSHRGEKSHFWLGGISETGYPPEWTPQLRESIRERDGHICQMPGCGKTEQENGRKLDVHHKDYDKQNCDPDNLISLCRCCHMETNSNIREYWQRRFQNGI